MWQQCYIIYMLEHLILNGRLQSAYLYHQVSPRSYKEQLMASFSKGKRKDFLRLFLLLRHEEKLQFYLRVYFLIYSIHPSLKPKGNIPEEQVSAFRQFLQSKGSDLAKTNQFLQFYALSYVKKPLEHPSYKALFKKEWVTNLSQKLTLYLQEEERRMRQTLSKQQSQGKGRGGEGTGGQVLSANMHVLQQKNKRLFEEVQVFKLKYAQLQRNNQALIQSFNSHLMQSQHKWFQITRELTSNARTLVDLIAKSSSSLIHDRRYQRIKKRTQKFEKIVRKQLDELLNQSQDLSVFDKPSANEISYSAASVTPNVSQRNLTTYVGLDEFVPTNYVGLIKDFKRMGDAQKAGVLRGLSWRIIKSKNKWVRRQTIVALVVNDVLGLVNGDIQLLLFNSALTYFVLQLFLFVSEDCYGRRVLFRNGGLYKEVVDLIPQTLKTKNFSCLDLVLQILLNIWHNRDIYRELVGLNIIGVCINTLLQESQVLASDTLLQSIATLLLNATATEQGLDAFQYQVDVFYYLCEAFKGASDSNRNLIGAIIYALLGRRNLWKLAHEANLPNFIDDLVKIDERSNKQQLKLIQAKLHAFQPGKTIAAEEFEDEDSVDSDLQEENFERNEDELQELEEYIKGHQMLAAKYSLKQKEAEKQLQQINKIMNQNSKDEPRLGPAKHSKGKGEPRDSREERQRLADVRLPEIKKKKDILQQQKKKDSLQVQKKKEVVEIQKKKDNVQIYNPKAKNKQRLVEVQQHYAYKSPNFKQSEQRSLLSAQADSFDHHQAFTDKQKATVENEHTEQRRVGRVQTKPQERAGQSDRREQGRRRSTERPEYRIKKSSSVEKGLGHVVRRQEMEYETNKNVSNVGDYKSVEGVKSPGQKRSREEVLKQLNQELKAEKQQERKLSAKNIPASAVQRENTQLKRNNYVEGEEDMKGFESKPKLRRTPPKEQK